MPSCWNGRWQVIACTSDLERLAKQGDPRLCHLTKLGEQSRPEGVEASITGGRFQVAGLEILQRNKIFTEGYGNTESMEKARSKAGFKTEEGVKESRR